MDHRQQQERRGPQFYVHVEFGVSWSRKTPPKNHEVTYRSRNMREMNFPRQVPAPNTNYLAAIRAFEERQTRSRQSRLLQPGIPNSHHAGGRRDTHHQMQEFYQAGAMVRGRDQRPVDQEQTHQSRQTRADSRPSYERGHSAPPPIGENPWDVNFRGGRSGDPSGQAHAQLDQDKALPAAPSLYRLGEDGLPWSAWSYPMGYDPDSYPQDEEEEEPSAIATSSRQVHQPDLNDIVSPVTVSVFSPEQTMSRPREDHGKGRDLGALSAAMMTVDNGFENQWWYQGGRETVEKDELAPQTPSLLNRFSTGSMPESPMQGRMEDMGSFAVATSHVSPLDSSMSPPSGFLSLHRSMSTRSEELWLSERGNRQSTF